MSGDPKFRASQELPDFGYAKYAESLGLKGIRIDAPDRVGPAWDEALAATRPCLVEAIVDPEVPPLPPHVTVEQATSMMKALLKGDPNAGDVVRQTPKEALQAWLPR